MTWKKIPIFTIALLVAIKTGLASPIAFREAFAQSLMQENPVMTNWIVILAIIAIIIYMRRNN